MWLALLLAADWPQPVEQLDQAPGEGTLVLAIHGLGDKPSSFQRLFVGQPLDVLLPAGPARHNLGYSWFDVRVKSGEVEKLSSGIAHSAGMLAKLLEAEAPDGDAIITGFSQGGYMSLAVATMYPERVKKAVSVGGGLPEPLWPQDIPASGGPELVILHGEADKVVPVGPTLQAAEHLKGLGWQVELHTYPGVEHSISTEMREELYAELAED